MFHKMKCDDLKFLGIENGLAGWDVSESSAKSMCKEIFYAMKLDSRVEGPWEDRSWEDPPFIPRQFQISEEELYPYQKAILASRDVFEKRVVNILLDIHGNMGKSTLSALGELVHRGIDLPIISDHKELIQVVCCKLRDTNNRDPKLIMLDLPRALTYDDKRIGPYMMAIEQIKKGHVFDCRNHYKDWWFNSPQVWVFCNQLPNLSMLSKDRWRVYRISEARELETVDYSEFVQSVQS